MREWLSGGVSPCQGEGRGFESRLALFLLSENIKLDKNKNLTEFTGCNFKTILNNVLD